MDCCQPPILRRPKGKISPLLDRMDVHTKCTEIFYAFFECVAVLFFHFENGGVGESPFVVLDFVYIVGILSVLLMQYSFVLVIDVF